MPEAEELFIDAARHATSAVQGVWRRREAARQRPGLLLADERQRLALLIEMTTGCAWPLLSAGAPAPVPLLRRWFRPQQVPAAPTQVLPGSDGRAVYLPPWLPFHAPAMPDTYALLAVLYALRCERGSAALCPADDPLAADLYLLAECIAADAMLRHLLPGWMQAAGALKAEALRALPPAACPRADAVLRQYRAFLAGQSHRVPICASAAESLDWARREAALLAAAQVRTAYRPCLADPVVGRLLPADASVSTREGDGRPAGSERSVSHTTVSLARRPRVREARPDEDDAQPGLWMVQTTVPMEHAEDPFGLNRPNDHAGAEDDAAGAADSLSELEQARLVSTPGRARETFVCPDAPSPVPANAVAPFPEAIGGTILPEWDFARGVYLERAVRVRLDMAEEGAADWAACALARHAGLLAHIRRQLGALRGTRQWLRRQPEGDDIDIDALVAARPERRAGLPPSADCYLHHRPKLRRLALLMMIDASGSTDASVADGARVIDVEKEAALVAACALDSVSAHFALYAFSGEGPAGVEVRAIKTFAAPWDEAARRRLGGIEPDRYTRLGAAVRHASTVLAREPADRRLLLLMSDGRPSDCDRYAGRYGFEDARQALAEARMQGLTPYCFTVDSNAETYVPMLFGAGRYTMVRHARQLPLAFVEWLRRAAREPI